MEVTGPSHSVIIFNYLALVVSGTVIDALPGTADTVLALIPASLLAAAAVAAAFPLSLATALALGSVPATCSIGYALFYDPPTAG